MLGKTLAIAAILLSAAGIFVSGTLSLIHARGALVPCGPTTDCAVVADSQYSQFLSLPVAYYGLAGYLLILILTMLGAPRAARMAFGVSIFGAAISAYLMFVSMTQIHAVCTWCVGSAVMMLLLMVVQMLRLRNPETVSGLARAIVGGVALCAAIGGAYIVAKNAGREYIDNAALRSVPVAELIPADVPSLGDKNAKVVIVEFADFACPACRRMRRLLEKLVADYNGVRLVFRHLPQKTIPGHGASGYAAVCAELAEQRGRFWEFADRAFSTPSEPKKADYDGVMKGLGIALPPESILRDTSNPIIAKLERDRLLARKLRITQTPVFVILSPELPPTPASVDLPKVLLRPQIASYIVSKK